MTIARHGASDDNLLLADRRVTMDSFRGGFRATPYRWQDPKTIPPREFLYGRHFIRKMVSATIAPGGTIKTSLGIVQALAMVTGRNLLHDRHADGRGILRVWLYNLEDPIEELTRRIQAVCLHYGITPEEIGDRLFVDSGRDQELVLAAMHPKTGAIVAEPVMEKLIDELCSRNVDVLLVDPFISSHAVSENDNVAIDMVVKAWGRIADQANCSIDLTHHTRKLAGGEVTVESSRGAKALTDAARSARVINRMSEKEAEVAGVENARLYHRVFNDKANLAPPSDQSDWYKLESIELGNGDNVGVVVQWKWPNPFDGMTVADLDKVLVAIAAGDWKESSQAKNWAGVAVAEVLGLDLTDAAAKAKVKSLLRTWIANKALKIVRKLDESRHPRPFIVVGEGQRT